MGIKNLVFKQIANLGNFQSLSYSSKIQHFDYENVSAVRCTSEWGQMTKLIDRVKPVTIEFFWGVVFSESARTICRKRYHVYKMIVVPHTYCRIVAIRLAGHPANKNKSLILIKFLVV